MVISIEQPRVAYAAVPKAGCTTAKLMLAQVDPAVRVGRAAEIDETAVHNLYQTGRFRLERWLPHFDGFCFTVIRDPVARLLAIYTNRVLEMGDLGRCRRIKRGYVKLPTDPDPDFFFQNILEYCDASSSIRHHAMPTNRFTGDRLDRFTNVYRTGELHVLAQDLAGLSGRDVVLPHANRSRRRLRLEDLRPATIRNLAVVLEPEYRFLADYFDSPFI